MNTSVPEPASPTTSCIRFSRFHLLFWSPFLLYLYPTLVGLVSKSEVPLYVGRYSLFLLVFNVANIGVYLLAVASHRRDWMVMRQISLISVILLSFCAVGNNRLQVAPLIAAVLPGVRLLGALAMIATTFQMFLMKRRGGNGVYLCAGFLVLITVVVDFGVLIWMTWIKPDLRRFVHQEFREDFDSTKISSNDVVIIGDSFVWGQGVEKSQAFGNVLGELYRQNGHSARVYSLGAIGAGLNEYLRFVERVSPDHKADRIILSFYHNDMPAKALLRERIQNLSFAFGVGSASLKIIGDMMGRALTPTADKYAELLIANYRQDDPNYLERWSLLKQNLDRFVQLAKARSEKAPLFVIIPLSVEFGDYPLSDVDLRLQRLAESLGFETLDPYPNFREEFGDGRNCRASSNDLHFNPQAHALLARLIKQRLSALK